MNPDFDAVESGAQKELLAKVKHLVPLCGPLWPLGPRPAAVMDVTPDGVAHICSYHDFGRGKEEADNWCLERSYGLSHGCCSHCGEQVKNETWVDLRTKPDPHMAELRKSFKLDRMQLAVYCARVDGDTGKLRDLGQLGPDELHLALNHLAHS